MTTYRADIDGLRALAVLPVVLFHAHLAGFSGGFVGVDIFFVISGFLITGILLKDIHQQQFSIQRFYERRIRRIFPALFLVLLATAIASYFWLIPKEFKDYGISLFGATLFFSNIVFWRQSGYFDLPAEGKPLLHTWSLAVEEQFYIVFPILLWALHKWQPTRWVTWLVGFALISFGYSVWGVTHDPEAAFYLASFRAWELLLGSILASQAIPIIHHHTMRQALSLLGFSMILFSITMLTKASPFPGINALFPCVGAALIIYTGVPLSPPLRDANHQQIAPSFPLTWVQTFLSHKLMVGIGLISYSLYLWHWPIFVFAQHLSLEQLSFTTSLLLVTLSIGIAFLSWKYIEAPFRASVPYASVPYAKTSEKPRKLIATRPLVIGSCTAMLLIGLFGLMGFINKGYKARFSAKVNAILAIGEQASKPGQCLSYPTKWIAPKDACLKGDTTTPPTLALWGDSHADAWVDPLSKHAKQHQRSFVFYGYSGCPPVLGVKRQGKGDNHRCAEYNRQTLHHLLTQPSIHTVVLIARHSAYIYGRNNDFGTAEATDTNPIFITDLTHAQLSLEQRKALYARQLENTVTALRNAGKHVVLVYPIPETGIRIPQRVAQLIITGHDPNQFTRPANYFYQRQAHMLNTLDTIRPNDAGITRIKPHELLCRSTECTVFAKGSPLYQDDDHLSPDGVEYLKPLWQPLFNH